MDQLVDPISQRTGITADQARGAVQATLDFVKQTLPAPVSARGEAGLGGRVDSLVNQAPGFRGGFLGQAGAAGDKSTTE